MKKSWRDTTKAARCQKVLAKFSGTISKSCRIRPEIFACRTPMTYHVNAHENSSLNLDLEFP